MAARPEADRFELHMSDADALMWNIEKDPLLRSTIVTVLLFDRAPDWRMLVDRVERGTWLIPRMRQRVVTPLLRVGPPHWSSDPHFDLGYHLRRVRACEPTLDSVLDVARTAAMGGFDRARPLWEYTLVEGLHGDRAAMVLKVHHSMTDGVGGMKLLLMLFDFERDAPEPGPLDRVDAVPTFDPLDLVLRAIGHRRRRILGMARRGVLAPIGIARSLGRDPLGTTREAVRNVESVLRYLAPATVPRSPLLRTRSLARHVRTLEVPVDDLKRAAKCVGGSLNDAFMAAVVGGVQAYHRRHDSPVEELRMVMPINVRTEGAALGGNHFTPARFVVPAAVDDPAERMTVLRDIARRVRDEPAIRLTDALAGVFNQLPTTVITALFGAMLKGADLVALNVPGAPFPIYLAGAELEGMYPFGPLSGTAINVTLLSYCGRCCIGVNTDAVTVPDTDAFLADLRSGFAEVVALG